MREHFGRGQFLDMWPFSSQLKHLTFDKSIGGHVCAMLPRDGPCRLVLAWPMSMGTGTLLKFLGALEELYWGQGAWVDNVFCCQFCWTGFINGRWFWFRRDWSDEKQWPNAILMRFQALVASMAVWWRVAQSWGFTLMTSMPTSLGSPRKKNLVEFVLSQSVSHLLLLTADFK